MWTYEVHILSFVLEEGLEPSRLSAIGFESIAYTIPPPQRSEEIRDMCPHMISYSPNELKYAYIPQL